MNKYFANSTVLLAIAIFVILIDQVSKNWASKNLEFLLAKPFLPGLIKFRLAHNTGAAFNIFSESTLILGMISLIISIGLILYIFKHNMDFPLNLGMAFLLGGCVGNGIDRWTLGYVVDFIELHHINFPIFNIADISINLAFICFIFHSINPRSKTDA